MHQWSTSTCFTLAMRSTGTVRHQIEIPRLALIHECLLDTVFALTSLHLAHLRPHEAHAYISDAMRYQASALASTRMKLQNVTATECEALYHASGQLGAIALAFRSVDPNTAKTSKPSETLWELSQLWKGTDLILQASRRLVDAETLNMFRPKLDWNVRRPSLAASQTQVYLDRLRKRAMSGDYGTSSPQEGGGASPIDEATSLVYVDAIDLLHGTFHADSPEPSRVIAWFVMVKPPFFDFLRQGAPLARALVLLYTLLMQDLDNIWWTSNLRQQVIDELAPLVAASEPDLAEIADYVQRWTKPTDTLISSATVEFDPAVAGLTQWTEGHTIDDIDLKFAGGMHIV